VNKKKKKLTTSKIVCTKCGSKKGMSKDRFKKLVNTFGSIEELHAKYVCRNCRKEHNMRKDGRVKPTKRRRKVNKIKTLPKHLRTSNRGITHARMVLKGKREKEKFNKVLKEALKKYAIPIAA